MMKEETTELFGPDGTLFADDEDDDTPEHSFATDPFVGLSPSDSGLWPGSQIGMNDILTEEYAMSDDPLREWQETGWTEDENRTGDWPAEESGSAPYVSPYPSSFDPSLVADMEATDRLLSDNQRFLNEIEQKAGGGGEHDWAAGEMPPVSPEVASTISFIDSVMGRACEIRDAAYDDMEDYLQLDAETRAQLDTLSPEERRAALDEMLSRDADERRRELRERAEAGDEQARAKLEAWNTHSASTSLEGQVYEQQVRNEVRESEQEMRDSNTAHQYRIWEDEARIEADSELKKAHDRLSRGESGADALEAARRELERADYYRGVADDYDPKK